MAAALSALAVGVVVDDGVTIGGGKATCGDRVRAGSVLGYCPWVLMGSRLGTLRRGFEARKASSISWSFIRCEDSW